MLIVCYAGDTVDDTLLDVIKTVKPGGFILSSKNLKLLKNFGFFAFFNLNFRSTYAIFSIYFYYAKIVGHEYYG